MPTRISAPQWAFHAGRLGVPILMAMHRRHLSALKRWAIPAVVVCVAGTLLGGPMVRKLIARAGRHTVESRVAALSPKMTPVWSDRCAAGRIAYPPPRLTLVVLKQERSLAVYAPSFDGGHACLVRYRILAASGGPGPKLREGDKQVPEGIYGIESLNPMSRFHLALRVNYPNADDRAIAAAEGRTDLGSDIMIHGGAASIGCVAIGDEAIEELFFVAAAVGVERVEVILSPSGLPQEYLTDRSPAWLRERYMVIADRLRELGLP